MKRRENDGRNAFDKSVEDSEGKDDNQRWSLGTRRRRSGPRHDTRRRFVRSLQMFLFH